MSTNPKQKIMRKPKAVKSDFLQMMKSYEKQQKIIKQRKKEQKKK